MKVVKSIALAGIVMAPFFLRAQEKTDKDKTDTSEITVKVISRKNKDSVIITGNGQPWVKASRQRNVETSWFGIDLGFANFADHTNYGSAGAQAYAPGSNANWFDLRFGKSVNVNIWVLTQKVNLVNHVLHLKYALGMELNNYRFENAVRFNPHPGTDAPDPAVVYMDNEPDRNYSKNKLAADYVTVPLMLNVTFPSKNRKVVEAGNKTVKVRASREFGFSLGMSAGYLYSARNKTITSDNGKQKAKDNFELNPWKLSYVGELNLGYVSLYGSYAVKSMFKRGLDMTPYTMGIRLGL
ncbi:hypothetical protein A8C56_17325 [Niabella ginsenosidivorans]|uniref:Outer membrane protein beta-barrel domain-containing protein n=1 Tax=Niabella ginsenosidivorans TaxID=1176587 RepID=A0A1A9I492_9BACT|nr:hypothetical protein [Niabella ginsenosidivorans]ANH82497.1 hypothetical protein A8C56_17325 [Niabella ginsenosidivorans]